MRPAVVRVLVRGLAVVPSVVECGRVYVVAEAVEVSRQLGMGTEMVRENWTDSGHMDLVTAHGMDLEMQRGRMGSAKQRAHMGLERQLVHTGLETLLCCSIDVAAELASATGSGHKLAPVSHTLAALAMDLSKLVCDLARARHDLESTQRSRLVVLESSVSADIGGILGAGAVTAP